MDSMGRQSSGHGKDNEPWPGIEPATKPQGTAEPYRRCGRLRVQLARIHPSAPPQVSYRKWDAARKDRSVPRAALASRSRRCHYALHSVLRETCRKRAVCQQPACKQSKNDQRETERRHRHAGTPRYHFCAQKTIQLCEALISRRRALALGPANPGTSPCQPVFRRRPCRSRCGWQRSSRALRPDRP